MKTHPHFKSIYSDIENIDIVNEMFEKALCFQYRYERRTSRWENFLWFHSVLHSFKIDLEEVDRLYYICHYKNNCEFKFCLIVRLDHNGKMIYAKMIGKYSDGSEGGGTIFVSHNVNTFMNFVLTSDDKSNRIRHFLKKEDGIRVKPLDRGIPENYKRMWDFDWNSDSDQDSDCDSS